MTDARRDARRRADLARIHVLKKQLAYDDETYRAVLQRVSGVRSSADLDGPGRGRLIAEMERLGGAALEQGARRARFKRITAAKPKDVGADKAAMVKKVEALLAAAERPWAYAHGLAKRMFNTTRVEWLRPDQLHKLIAALSIDAKRRAKRAEISNG